MARDSSRGVRKDLGIYRFQSLWTPSQYSRGSPSPTSPHSQKSWQRGEPHRHQRTLCGNPQGTGRCSGTAGGSAPAPSCTELPAVGRRGVRPCSPGRGESMGGYEGVPEEPGARRQVPHGHALCRALALSRPPRLPSVLTHPILTLTLCGRCDHDLPLRRLGH